MKKTLKRRSRRQDSYRERQKNPFVMSLGFYVVLAIMAVTQTIPWVVVGWYVFIGIVTYAVYAKDKKAAVENKWRTSESILHLLSVVGGWVGARVAQNKLRHKTQKSEFRMVYYLTVLINLAGLIYLMSNGSFPQFQI